MKAHDIARVFAEVVPSLAASATDTAGLSAIHHHGIAGAERGDAKSDRGDLTGGLCTDHERHFTLGECHAAEGPEIEVVEADRLHPDLNLARTRRRRRIQLD